MVLLAIGGVAQAQTGTQTAASDSWQINLKEADIGAFISQVADITGKSFVVDPRVKGKVNVLTSEAMNKDAVYELFLSVLQVQGYRSEERRVGKECRSRRGGENE